MPRDRVLTSWRINVGSEDAEWPNRTGSAAPKRFRDENEQGETTIPLLVGSRDLVPLLGEWASED